MSGAHSCTTERVAELRERLATHAGMVLQAAGTPLYERLEPIIHAMWCEYELEHALAELRLRGIL
jgi:hypothetical protein